jgi:predicted RNA-binding Zn ribbon-like protein
MHVETYADRAVALANATLDDLAGVRTLLRNQALAWHADRAVEADLDLLRAVRDELRVLFADAGSGHDRSAVERLNRLLRAWPVTPRVSGHDSGNWHLHVTGTNEAHPLVAEEYVTSAVYGLAVALTEHGAEHLGVCAGTNCSNAFLERNSGRPRRWCSDRCATRAHVAAYRTRQKVTQAQPPLVV